MNQTYHFSQDFFVELFESGVSKTICLTYSLLTVPILVLTLLSIIWYEKFCSDAKRTLLNRFLSSACWTCIEFVVLVQTADLLRYFYGPLPENFCLIHLSFKNAVVVQVLLFLDSIVVARYFFVFRLKNPAGFQDEFWYRFVNIWVVGFSTLSQFVFVWMPGQ